MRTGDVVAERFVIEAHAGAGGMGTVYRARDRETNRVVALKHVGPDGEQSRFEQEARLLAELDHPGIVRYVAHGRAAEGARYLVMEWLDGDDLRTHLALHGPLSMSDAWEIARRLGSALAYAHAHGIVHRDIKPANVLVERGELSRAKLLDFGIARSARGGALDTTVVPITRTGTVVGTVGYMSPEQAVGSADIDARSDVFALGCVLFEAMTGRPAFSGPNAVSVLAKLLLEDPPRVRHLVPSVPPRLDELVARMLAKDPAARPRDAAAVLRAIELSGSGASSGSSSGVGDREKRMVTIVLVRGAEGPVEGGLRLADGAVLLEVRGEDPATIAAGRALDLAQREPKAAIAIATGRVTEKHADAYGPIIDRVSTLAPATSGIAIDEVSAALLCDKFMVAGGVLLGPAKKKASPRTLLGRQTPCVGRDKELALLRATVEEATDDLVGRAVLITGVAGSGKSRLGYELISSVEPPTTVLLARCHPVGAGSALHVARQLVRDAAHMEDRSSLAEQHAALRRHLDRFFTGDAFDRLAEMLGELAGAPPAVPSAQLRGARSDARILASWLSKSFAEWLAALADAGPVVCLIEDLHWGDGTSVAYLEEALVTNAARPFVVVALARPEVHDLFPSMWPRASVQEVRLGALTRRAAERLVRAALVDPDAETLGRVIDHAEGNPFHLEELIRHVAERGSTTLPDSVLAIPEARLARLDPEARRFLRIASIFGETFWEPGVAALLGPDACAADVVARLVETEVVAPAAAKTGAKTYQFRHSLLRDAAYAMLADDDRAALHVAAAEWLDAQGEADPLVLAEHFERGGRPARAVPLYLRAATRAFNAWNVWAATSLAERGVSCGATGVELGELRCIAAIAAVGRADHRTATRLAKEAVELLPIDSPSWYVAAATVLSSGAYVGDYDLAPQIVQVISTSAPAGPPSGHYGLAIRLAADILDALDQFEATEQVFARARSILEETAEPDRLFVAHLRFAEAGMALRRDLPLGGLAPGVQAGHESAAVTGDPFVIGMFHFGLGCTWAELGDLEAARESLERSMDGLDELHLFKAWSRVHLGWCDWFQGRYTSAIAYARAAAALDPRHGHTVVALAQLGAGNLPEAQRVSALALDGIEDALVTPFVVALARAVGARVALAAGRVADAIRLATEAQAFRGGPPFARTFVDRTRVEAELAAGHDVAALLASYVARIERHATSLEEPRRSAFRALPDVARLLELAQR